MTQISFNEYFNTAARRENVTRADMLANCLNKALRAKTDDKVAVATALIKKAFTPPSKRSKVANGGLDFWGFHHAKYEMRWGNLKVFFEDTFEDMLELANKVRF